MSTPNRSARISAVAEYPGKGQTEWKGRRCLAGRLRPEVSIRHFDPIPPDDRRGWTVPTPPPTRRGGCSTPLGNCPAAGCAAKAPEPARRGAATPTTRLGLHLQPGRGCPPTPGRLVLAITDYSRAPTSIQGPRRCPTLSPAFSQSLYFGVRLEYGQKPSDHLRGEEMG